MTNRRRFITGLGISAAAGRGGPWQGGSAPLAQRPRLTGGDDGQASLPERPAESDRQYWIRQLTRLADPVLRHLAAGTLKRNMPVECVTGNPAERAKYTHLEAIGRLLAGIAPWLEAPLEAGAEHDLQQWYRGLAREAIRSATDPQSPDFLNFHEGSQPLVDCGFLAQALLRAPNEL